MSRIPDKVSFDKYHSSGFTYLQYVVAKIVLRHYDPSATLRIGVTPMKTDKYTKNGFLADNVSIVVIIMMLCYIASIFRIISMIVQDKEQKTREGMKMMGLRDTAYWASLFAYYIIILTVVAILLASITRGLLFMYSNWFILFIFFFLYGISLFSFCLLIAALFQKGRIAGVTGIIVYFATFVIYVMVDSQNISANVKFLCCFIQPLAESLGILSISKYERGNIGVNFSNATEFSYNFRFSTSLLMMVGDAAIYAIIGLYLDNVLPSPEGVRKHPLFFLSREFWVDDDSAAAAAIPEQDQQHPESAEDEDKILYPDEHFGRISEELRGQEQSNQCLKVRHLKKSFGFKQAVEDFSVNMYKGQIFALLGTNGAGKTTTISMLTGLLPPTGGSAHFAGFPIFQQMSRLRQMLGVCPQHDVLFEALTPREHLEIFAAFKGRNDTEKIERDVDEILQDIDLKSVEDVCVCNLSGGQQRKLSIGIAFIGKSDMIFLDEPTSGIDLSARKKVWAMLKKYKAGKVIILTTHYMEEAEELGDRIGIMASGTLKCVGDPLFLKSVYGVGYNLIVAKRDEKTDDAEITEFLAQRVPGVKKRRQAGNELTYFLPKEQSDSFKRFFLDLDSHLDQLRIQSYGMTTNTLEEIFLKVVSGTGKDAGPACDSNVVLSAPASELDTYSIANEPEPSFISAFSQHFLAVLSKRYCIAVRSLGSFLGEVFAPLLVVLLGLISTLVPFYFDGDPRWFTGDAYDSDQNVLVTFSPAAGASGLADTFLRGFDSGVSATKYVPSVMGATSDDMAAMQGLDTALFSARGNAPVRYGSAYVKNMAQHVYEFVVFANISSQDSAGAFMDYFAQAMLRTATNNSNIRLVFANAPLPLDYETRSKESATSGDVISQTTTAAFAFIPASIVALVAREVEDNLKHQQVVSGILLSGYWAGNMLFDLVRTLVQAAVTIGLIGVFGNTLPQAWWFVLSYAFTILPFTYASSFMFAKENAAQVATLLFHFLVGIILTPVVITLRTFDSTKSAGKALMWMFRVIPSFGLSDGISNVAYKKFFAAQDGTAVPDDLAVDCAGPDLWFLLAGFAFYCLILWTLETTKCAGYGGCCEPKIAPEPATNRAGDDAVAQDAMRCDTLELSNGPPALLVRHIRKLYRTTSSKVTEAVGDISFSAMKGECLAILGASGAGKTTTFKIITLDVVPTQGDIFVNGTDLHKNFATVRRQIGYAPQYESAYMLLTVRENLDFYAKIKGIPAQIRDPLIRKMISDMDIGKYEKVQAGQLSGGNRRKLTVAIAMLGNPPVVLLDEPSTGVDPQARRFMWHVIQKISTKNRNTAVILTTHLMEEAEYLCTKMAMMVSGNFSCVGTPQELKAKYGKGYEVEINVPLPCEKEERELVQKLMLPAELGHDEIVGAFTAAGRPDLASQLTKAGHAAHIQAELDSGRRVKAETVASFIMVEQQARGFAVELAREFGGVSVAEHIGNFFKFRLNRTRQIHTIGFLFGLVQDLIRKYGITQYSAAQTSLGQIFDSFVKKQDYGLAAEEERIVEEEKEKEGEEVAVNIPGEHNTMGDFPSEAKVLGTSKRAGDC